MSIKKNNYTSNHLEQILVTVHAVESRLNWSVCRHVSKVNYSPFYQLVCFLVLHANMGSILAYCLLWRIENVLSWQHWQTLLLESGCIASQSIPWHKSWKSRSGVIKVSNPALYAVELRALRPYLVLKFPESDDLFGSSHRAVINDGRLLSTAALHMMIHSIVAHVQLPSNEPGRGQQLRELTFCRLLNMLLKCIYVEQNLFRHTASLSKSMLLWNFKIQLDPNQLQERQLCRQLTANQCTW